MIESSERLEFRGGIMGALIAPATFLVGVIAYFVIFRVFDMNALTASGLAGLLIAGLFARRYSQFWDSVILGVSSRTSITLLLILLIVSLVSALIKQTGVSGGFVWLASSLGVSGGWFIAVTFIVVCAIAMSTGTSIGTMFTAFPIFYPAGVILGADPLLLAGAILSGALFGDNLAPISDSTIVSSSTQKYRNKEGSAEIGGVVRARAKYSLVAAGISAILFLVIGSLRSDEGGSTAQADVSGTPLSLIMLIPIAILLFVAFWKRDIFLAATIGLISGIALGLLTGLLSLSDVMSANEDGTPGGFLVAGIADILPLIGLGIVIFGIIGVLQQAGIFDLIVDAVAKSAFAKTPMGAEIAIGVGALATATIFAGVNGPSMIMFGPVADRIGAAAGLHPYRRANVMDCVTLGLGSVVPVVSSFLLIASLLTQGHDSAPVLSAPSIFLAAFYPLVLTLVILVAILTGWGRRFEGANGEERKTPLPARISDDELEASTRG
ncbi:transporter, NhaC family [Cryobacterium psychrotolerans]|uniref:Transporter, NhaC family n=2 Tax=Cryobacterium psychrotolerans TaxID=386301 RepID=A0A1G9B9T0_9MICO|nr:Na+/H+ antiporter NhaC family protein [Cryobacterium psychrotolerans]SDK36257.1 transporter, NhaC family [Cryobacterium psychrotolerans]